MITYSVMCIVHLIHIVIIWNFNLGLLDIRDRIPAVESQINQRKEAFLKKLITVEMLLSMHLKILLITTGVSQ